MNFPSPMQYVFGVILLVVGIAVVIILARALKLRPPLINIIDPKKEAILAIWIIILATIVRAVWQPFIHIIYVPALHLSNHLASIGFANGVRVDGYDILAWFIVYSIMITAVALVMKKTHQKLESIGISKANLGKMITIGISLGLIYLVIASLVSFLQGRHFSGFSSTLVYFFFMALMIGFSEEVIWRGYAQTRLIARIGKMKGFLVTSISFAFLWIFPLAYYTEASGDVLGALAFSSLRVFPSLLMGYVMVRYQNIVPSSIFHFLYDFTTLLWI